MDEEQLRRVDQVLFHDPGRQRVSAEQQLRRRALVDGVGDDPLENDLAVLRVTTQQRADGLGRQGDVLGQVPFWRPPIKKVEQQRANLIVTEEEEGTRGDRVELPVRGCEPVALGLEFHGNQRRRSSPRLSFSKRHGESELKLY